MTTNIQVIRRSGGLKSKSLLRIARAWWSSSCVWECSLIFFLVFAICSSIDIAVFKMVGDAFLFDRTLIRIATMSIFYLGLDVVGTLLGTYLRRKNDGIDVKVWLLYLLCGVFVVTYICYVLLRVALRDEILPSFEMGSSFFDGNTEAPDANPYSVVFTVMSCCAPLLTSIVLFFLGYVSSNTQSAEDRRFYLLSNNAVNDIARVLGIIEQFWTIVSVKSMSTLHADSLSIENLKKLHLQRLLETDDVAYELAMLDIDLRVLELKEYHRARMREARGAAEVSAFTASIDKVVAEAKASS